MDPFPRRAARALTAACAVAATVLVAAGCGRAGPIRAQPLDETALDPTPREADFLLEELDTWREGTVIAVPDDPKAALEGAPIAGAKVELFCARPDGTPPLRRLAETTADAEGRFRVGPGPRAAWMLRASAPGFAPSSGGSRLAFPGTVELPLGGSIKFGLRAAHPLSGRVVNEAGGGIEGAGVTANGPGFHEKFATDAQGRFTLGAPTGPIDFDVSAPGGLRKRQLVTVPQTGAVPEVSVVVLSTDVVRGWVVSSPEGRRIAGATVISVEDPSIRTRTGDDGTFALPASRRSAVAAFADGWGWRSMPVPRGGELEFRLEPATPVAGHVVDSNGAPAEGARVFALVRAFNGAYERVFGPCTAADGSYRFPWVPRQVRGDTGAVRVFAIRRDAGESLAVPVPAPDARARLDLRLLGAEDVSGTVRDGEGGPIAGALVEAHWEHSEDLQEVEAAGALLLRREAATTDPQGRYRIRGVALGLGARIRCEAIGVTLERRVEEGRRVGDPMDFVVAAARVLCGRVADRAGKPVAAHVTAQLLDTPGVEVSRAFDTGADGAFRFRGLPEGRYQLRAEAQGFDLPGGKVAQAGEQEIVLTPERAGTLVLHFVPEGARPPEVPLEVLLRTEPAGGQEFQRTIAAGEAGKDLEIAGAWPAKWVLTAVGDVWRADLDPFELHDGERRVVDVPLIRTLRLAARLTRADGAPIAGELVVASPASGTVGRTQSVRSDDGGLVDLTGLRPGKWRITAMPRGLVPVETEVEVGPAREKPLELRAATGGVLTVRVHHEDKPLAGALVKLAEADGGRAVPAWSRAAENLSSHFRTGADGRVVIQGIPPGTVRVEVASEGSTLDAKTVKIVDGESSTIDVP